MLTHDRFVLPRRLLPSLMLLAQSPNKSDAIPPATLTELRRTGLVTPRGALIHHVEALVRTMSEASLVSSIDVRAGGCTHASTIWATAGAAAIGRQVDEDFCELTPLRPTSLPLVTARIVEVGRRPDPPFLGAGSLSDRALELALQHLSDSPESALDIMVAAGLDRTWADRLLIAHEHMKSHWTISSVWTDRSGGHRVRSLSVLDGGAAGYWRIQRQPTDPPSNRYSVVTLEQVMRLLRAALPPPALTD